MNDMRRFRSLQAEFFQALVDGSHVPEAGIFCENGINARERLNIYFNNSRIMQGDALSSIYPAVRRLVGSDFFDHMSILYAEAYPLSCGDLRTFGSNLPDFIEQFEPLITLPYMRDMARLEWACHESMHASQKRACEASQSPRNAVFLAPHVRLIRSDFPVAQIWDFALREQTSDSRRLDISNSGPCCLLIMRPQLDVEVLELQEEEWEWLANIGKAFVRTDTVGAGEQHRRQLWASRGVLLGPVHTLLSDAPAEPAFRDTPGVARVP